MHVQANSYLRSHTIYGLSSTHVLAQLHNIFTLHFQVFYFSLFPAASPDSAALALALALHLDKTTIDIISPLHSNQKRVK